MLKSSGDRLLMLAAIRVVGLVGGVLIASLVPLPSRESLPFLLGAAAIHYVYYLLLLNSYRVGDISQVYPIARGLAPLLVLLLGALLAGEVLGYRSLLGVCVLSAGICVLALSGRATARAATVFAVGTGVAIAGYSFLSGVGIRKAGSLLGYIAWLEIATGVGLVSGACVQKRGAVLEFARSHWRSATVAGVFSVGGYAIALWAMSEAPLAPVVALRETSVVFAAIFGSVLLRESFGAARTAAAIVVVVGIAFLVVPAG